jgi:hypothetical protein
MKVRFQGWDCELRFQAYGNGRQGIVLVDARDGQDVAVATVNVPGALLGEKQVLIKDYSENEGMLQALERAGIVKATGQTVRSGFATIPVCDLLVEPVSKVRDRARPRRKARDIEPER